MEIKIEAIHLEGLPSDNKVEITIIPDNAFTRIKIGSDTYQCLTKDIKKIVTVITTNYISSLKICRDNKIRKCIYETIPKTKSGVRDFGSRGPTNEVELSMAPHGKQSSSQKA